MQGLNGGRFLFLPQGICESFSRHGGGGGREKLQGWTPEQLLQLPRGGALPARQGLRIQEQGQIATSGREGRG